MANSNNRTKETDTVHHLVSRIAHRVYFLKDEERDEFIDMMRRSAEFCCLELIGWCIMTNHFHILVYLPNRRVLEEDEILRRYGVLKGDTAAAQLAKSFEEWRLKGESGEKLVKKELDKLYARMFDVGEFMKILKQWFSMEYNRRYSHKGTLWESAYHDRIVEQSISKMAECLGYIHLNPIRAAVVDKFDGYFWSSYTAFRRGNRLSEKGMRFIYGDDDSLEEITERHESLLERLLEKEKLRRAEEIARKRAAGYEMPVDSLTTEAMIAQASAHLEKVRSAAVEMHESTAMKGRRAARNNMLEVAVREILERDPDARAKVIQDALGVSLRTAYRLLKKVRR